MPALTDPANLALPKFEDGDAGIILKADGTFLLWNTYKDLNPANMTERQLEQGKVLMAFAAALKLPQIMDVLLQIASDPAIFDNIVDSSVAH